MKARTLDSLPAQRGFKGPLSDRTPAEIISEHYPALQRIQDPWERLRFLIKAVCERNVAASSTASSVDDAVPPRRAISAQEGA